MERITAGIIVIGNEILSGRTQDMNANFIASKLQSKGVLLEEVRVIRDEKEAIASSVREFSKKYTYVFTTGGIGPTHDDITSESVAYAIGKGAEYNNQALDIMKKAYEMRGESMPFESRKMALMPKGAELIKNDVTSAPGFRIDNIYVMAGIPSIMQSMFMSLLPSLKGGEEVLSMQISVLVGEGKIAQALHDLQNMYTDVEMGSYPFKHKGDHATSLVLTSSKKSRLEAAYNSLKDMVKEYEIVA